MSIVTAELHEEGEGTGPRIGELIDWLRRMHFDDTLEGVVVLAIQRREPNGDSEGAIRSCLYFGVHDPHIETIREWIKVYEQQTKLMATAAKGTA